MGKKRIKRTVPERFGLDTFGVGCDTGSPLCNEYKPPFVFTGVIKKTGEGRVDQTEPFIFSADKTCDIGFEAGSLVPYDYLTHGGKFSGEVNWIEINVDKDAEDLDHFISPEERLRGAMAIQ